MVSGSNLKGLTLINTAGNYDFKDMEYSGFERNVRALKELKNIIVDVRWQRRSRTGYNLVDTSNLKPE